VSTDKLDDASNEHGFETYFNILLVLDGTEAPVLKRVINSDTRVLFTV